MSDAATNILLNKRWRRLGITSKRSVFLFAYNWERPRIPLLL